MKTYIHREKTGREVLHISLLPDDITMSAVRNANAVSNILANEKEKTGPKGAKPQENKPKMSNFKKINRMSLLGTLPALN